MGIVHGALRRDLLRTRDALTSVPYPRGRQRRAPCLIAWKPSTGGSARRLRR